MEDKKNDKILRFANSTLLKLQKIVPIKEVDNDNKFNEWFSYQYKITKEEDTFLTKLIEKHKLFLSSYNEQTLITKFISPLLNKVDFSTETFKDWYEYKISCEIGDWKLTGEPDYLIASGVREPVTPYFFINEFKPLKSTTLPDDQLVAELLTALELNKKTEIKGGYIINRYWHFVILEKLKNNTYQYYISKSYDSLVIEDLQMIYTFLQAVKFNYCK